MRWRLIAHAFQMRTTTTACTSTSSTRPNESATAAKEPPGATASLSPFLTGSFKQVTSDAAINRHHSQFSKPKSDCIYTLIRWKSLTQSICICLTFCESLPQNTIGAIKEQNKRPSPSPDQTIRVTFTSWKCLGADFSWSVGLRILISLPKSLSQRCDSCHSGWHQVVHNNTH